MTIWATGVALRVGQKGHIFRLRFVDEDEFERLDPTGLSPVNVNTPEEFEDASLRLATGADRA